MFMNASQLVVVYEIPMKSLSQKRNLVIKNNFVETSL